MLPLGTPAPDFSLPAPNGAIVSLNDFSDARALVVMFICNHCPFVHLVRSAMADLAKTYQAQDVAFVAINSNDFSQEKYAGDSPAQMAAEIKAQGYSFPYLVDETQAVAKAYKAACTPDFYVFDHRAQLTYRGQFDDARPGNDVLPSGRDLQAAIEATLAGTPIPDKSQKPSIGCNIKWKPGHEPAYFNQ